MKNRINELLNTPRLEFKYKQSNTTLGLYHLISKYIKPEHTVVELGSFAGVSSELFAIHCKLLYCVDRWEPYWEINQENLMFSAETKFDEMKKNYPNIVKVKNDSIDAVKLFEDESIDFLYIDSDHSSEQVTKELNAWFPKIKKNCYIGGHDINLPTVFNSVMNKFDPTLVELFNDTSWITKKI